MPEQSDDTITSKLSLNIFNSEWNESAWIKQYKIDKIQYKYKCFNQQEILVTPFLFFWYKNSVVNHVSTRNYLLVQKCQRHALVFILVVKKQIYLVVS